MRPKAWIVFSLRQYKCLFVAVVVLCAILGMAALQFRSQSLVNVPEELNEGEGEGKRKALAVEETSAPYEEKQSPKHVDKVKFLPVISAVSKDVEDEQIIKQRQFLEPSKQDRLRKVVDGPTLFREKTEENGAFLSSKI